MLEMLKRLEEEHADDQELWDEEDEETEDSVGEGEMEVGTLARQGDAFVRTDDGGKEVAFWKQKGTAGYARKQSSKALKKTRNQRVLPIEERLAGLDLSCENNLEQVWARLTEEEREEFKRALASGSVLALLGEWRPWWLPVDPILRTDIASRSDVANEASPLVRELNEEDGKEFAAQMANISPEMTSTVSLLSAPSLPTTSNASKTSATRFASPRKEEIPPLKALLGDKAPAWNLIFNLVDILFSYAFVCRMCHGEVDDAPLETVELLVLVSPVLGHSAVHASVSVALRSILALIYDVPELKPMLPHSAVALKDVEYLLASPNHVERALLHVLAISKNAKRSVKEMGIRAVQEKACGTLSRTNAGTNVSVKHSCHATPTAVSPSHTYSSSTTFVNSVSAQGAGNGTRANDEGVPGKAVTQVHRKATFFVSWWRWVCDQGYVRAMQTDDGTAVAVSSSSQDILSLIRTGVEEEREQQGQEEEERRASRSTTKGGKADKEQVAIHNIATTAALIPAQAGGRPLIEEL